MKTFSVILAVFSLGFSLEAGQAKVSSAKDHVKKQTKSGKGQLEIFAKGKNAFFAKLSLAAGAKVPLHKDATEEFNSIKGHSDSYVYELLDNFCIGKDTGIK